MTSSKKHINYKTISIVVLSIALILTGTGIWVANHYKGIIKDNLPQWVATATDSSYKVSVEDININIFTRSVKVTNLYLWPDSNNKSKVRKQFTYTRIHIPELKIKGIKWAKLATEVFDCKQVELLQPQIVIDHLKDSTNDSTDSTHTSKIKEIHIGDIRIEKPSFSYNIYSKNDTSLLFAYGGTTVLHDWQYKPDATIDTTRILFSKSSLLVLDSFSYQKQGGIYHLSTLAIYFNSATNTLEIHDIKLLPIISRAAFYKRVGHQKEIFHVHLSTALFKGFNWSQLLYHKKLITDSIQLNQPDINVYFSRIPPANTQSKLGKYPNQLLLKVPLAACLPYIYINNGNLHYTELNKQTGKTGVLRFEKVNGTLKNVTNLPDKISTNKNCRVYLKGIFNGYSPIAAYFNFYLADSSGIYSVDADLSNLNANQVTKDAQNLAQAEITSFHLDKLHAHISGNQYYNKGTVQMLYQNLKLNIKKSDGKGLKGRPIMTFLANNVILYSDNPMPGQDVRKVNTYLPRVKTKSFFNQIWKNIFSGAKQTAIKNQKITQIVEKKKK